MKKVLFILMIGFVLLLSSCQFSSHGELFDNEEKMVATGDTYSFLGKVEHKNDIKFKRFSGIYTLHVYREDEDFILDINLEIESGRFKCFLVNNDDEITLLNEGENIIWSDGSRIRLRIAGDDAVGSMTFSIKSS